MAIYPNGRLQPLPENSTQGKISPTQVVVHTAVDHPGPSDIPGYFARTDVTVESHFWIPLNGETVQMIDTNVRADANLNGNSRAISVETEDDGDPEGNPWTEAQLEALVELILWCHETHGIPLEVMSAWDAPGLGWHSMWGFVDGRNLTGGYLDNPWTNSRGKTCPGRTRIEQLFDVVFPAVQAGSTTDVGEAYKTIATANGNTYSWAVKLWQQRLNAWGYVVTVDGLVGPQTEAANVKWTELHSKVTSKRPGKYQWRRLLKTWADLYPEGTAPDPTPAAPAPDPTPAPDPNTGQSAEVFAELQGFAERMNAFDRRLEQLAATTPAAPAAEFTERMDAIDRRLERAENSITSARTSAAAALIGTQSNSAALKQIGEHAVKLGDVVSSMSTFLNGE